MLLYENSAEVLITIRLHKANKLWIHHNEEEKHFFIISAVFCPQSTFLLIVCHCFHFQVCFKEEITPFLYCNGFFSSTYSSFLPKNENTSVKKAFHLFWGSFFINILLFQRPCKNLRQHFCSLLPLIINMFIVLKKLFIFQRGLTFSQMLVSYQQYVALNERPHVSPLLILSFAQLDFFWMAAQTWCFTKKSLLFRFPQRSSLICC